jgi:hypothetical protein
MSDFALPVDHFALSELLRDPVIVRIVRVVNLTHLSILELLEYGFERKDVNRAMAKGVIEFDKAGLPPGERIGQPDVVQHVLETGDYFFNVLSVKIRLTKLGLYILDLIEDGEKQANAEGTPYLPGEPGATGFGEQAPHI